MRIFLLFFLLLFIRKAHCQTLSALPSVGVLYTGFTNYNSSSNPLRDFKSPIPTIGEYFGIEFHLNFRDAYTHKVNVQRTLIGITQQVSTFNKLRNGGMRYRGYIAIEQIILSYHLQRDLGKTKNIETPKRFEFFYALGVGVGFNKSKSHYRDKLSNDQYYTEYKSIETGGNSFFGIKSTHKQRGMGIFLIPEIGLNIYKKNSKKILALSLFIDKGLKQQVQSDVHYFYGDDTQPSLYTENDLKLSSRGTVIGCKVGVPIKIF